MRRPDYVALAMAIAIGWTIAYVDSRPTWNDTGVTAGTILMVSGTFAALRPSRPWLWALAVGLWVPSWAIASARNFGSLLALIFAFAGAYAGSAIRHAAIDNRPALR